MQTDLFCNQDALRIMYQKLRCTIMLVYLYDSGNHKARAVDRMIVRLNNKIGGDHQSRAAAVARREYTGKKRIRYAYARYADPITDLGCTRRETV